MIAYWSATNHLNRVQNQRSCKLHANHSQLVDALLVALGVSHDTCQKIMSDDLTTSHVTQHSVPQIQLQDQRDNRMTICGGLIRWIITGDETWQFLYDPQLKQWNAATCAT